MDHESHHPHPHGYRPHDDHFHPLPRTHHHTVIHNIRSAHPPHHHDSEARTRKHLIAQPRARQYFTLDGDLHKQCDDGVPRQAGKFELFLDLLYVGLVANFAEDCIHHPTSPVHLGKYILIFIPAWRIWYDLTHVMNMYYNDDVIQRFLIAWIMALMILYGNNAVYIDVSLSALQAATGAFVVARASIAIVNLYYSWTVHHHAVQLRTYNTISLLLLPLWAPLFLESVSPRTKIVFAVVVYALDHIVNIATNSKLFRQVFGLKHSTAIDIDHEVDRMAAFYIIVLGEFLYGLVWGSPAALSGVGGPFARAAMSMLIAFCLCWLYTASDGSRENPETGVHALRWRVANAMQWMGLHIPLSAALLVSGDVCAVLVKYGHDGVGVETHHKRAAAAESVFPAEHEWQALRWYFCGGLAIGIVCLHWIAVLHHEVDEDEETKELLFFPTKWRRGTRLPIAVVIALLPLAPPHRLSITGLLGVVTALLIFAVVWEMVGGLDRRWTVVETSWFCKRENVEVVGNNAEKDREVEEVEVEAVREVKE